MFETMGPGIQLDAAIAKRSTTVHSHHSDTCLNLTTGIIANHSYIRAG